MIVQYADATSSFNPRPRTEGDFLVRDPLVAAPLFQSTPSHGGRRVSHFRITPLPPVSIHALARRATLSEGQYVPDRWKFQSTPSHGGRLLAHNPAEYKQKVSIHALARRATRNIFTLQEPITGFNPRPRTEGDS
ncbi:hypothetical protein HKBW3S06_00478 [Candidatus Hakubella thermalkaliphila]|uniref:Uncharacterized protein n=1 Tax=Candidatus Hakubella thermalkaliphila TaxID=2754717 RepID=A0A6V8NLS8_9ACTN|nr:hypothetical protein HKBW3S06_00478 [Candidatus Hakubella thermalkaliphila]